jgi:N-acetylmuramoyl-L-alanine amidase
MVGESLVLVDGNSMHLRHPVDFYQGTVVVPCGFKEQILDTLFREAPGAKQALRIKKAVIDAGHGGTDPGAIGRAGLREKGVNLDIAKRVANILRNDGIEVVMTRPSDRFVLLNSRVEMANNSGADIFVSIHSNANRVRSLSGFEVYYVSPSVSDSQRALSAARYAPLNLDTAGLAGNSLDLKAILWDMVYTSNRAESIELARSISKAMNDNLEARLLGIKGARFEVLKGVRMPAVLVEVGFLSNAQEERLLKNNFYRQRIAESIAQGIRDYGCSALLAKADN